MWIVLIINLLVAIALAYFGLKERQEAFNWFTAGTVFIVFGLVLMIGAIPVLNDFDESSILMFTGGILVVIGIIALIIGFVTKATRIINLRDVAVAIEVAAVCLVYFIHNLNLNFQNLFVPELAAIIGLILFGISRRKIN
ncbi:hypothetical protein [Lactobacillus ultunensis]|uniref:Uncharacterized protein n=1 Tax=Lactobacillus ultunensis DSM 16047 TaxID=525365 RepID=C2EQ32_9LACO|nr:hypothetical protein [Lactobacillus ultunensis]EEJ71319.1 hypothetical protein HMPREF0548_1778 [Lactobacillus ultunensis DSM 16047]QQP28674.1 hypothetical protein H4B44_00750 [Lactobacillus ultunensis]